MVGIEGTRVRLREWRPGEVAAMHRWLGDPQVTRFLSWGARTRDDSATHLAECIAEQSLVARGRYFLAMELRESGRVIGDAGFEWTMREGHEREGGPGYFLEPAFWSKGYGTEAARLVLALAFDELDATVMRASCDAQNVASKRVLEKCEMQREPGREHPGRCEYRILASDWRSGPAGGPDATA